eukprot:COSAG05_NODE_13449_length_430_cov_0.622356_1_plen_61_part_10
MQRAGRGVSLRQAVRQEQREYEKVEFVDPNSSRSFDQGNAGETPPRFNAQLPGIQPGEKYG